MQRSGLMPSASQSALNEKLQTTEPPHTPPGPAQSSQVQLLSPEQYHLAGLMGGELAGPLNTLSQIVTGFSQTKRISRTQMDMLVRATEEANRIARKAQQIARLSNGKLRQSHERINITGMIEAHLQERQEWIASRGVVLHKSLKPVEVLIDPGLLHSLVEQALDWAIGLGERVLISLFIKSWPENAVLAIKVSGPALSLQPRPAKLDADDEDDAPPPAVDESLDDHLLNLLTHHLGVPLVRTLADGECTLEMEFARTVKQQAEGLSTTELNWPSGRGGNPSTVAGDSQFSVGTRPLVGTHILLITNDPRVRAEVTDITRQMGVAVEIVSNAERAARAAELDLPHIIIIDERERNPAFNTLRDTICAMSPNFGFIEIADAENTFEMSSWMGDSMTRISRSVLHDQLPSVLELELTKVM